MLTDLSKLRGVATGALSESVIKDAQDDHDVFDLENDQEFMQECAALCYPLIIQGEICDESATVLDEATTEAYQKLQSHFVGQGLITEAASIAINPKINLIHLNKEAQLARLKKIVTLKLARKSNSPAYKKYKIGVQIKKSNMEKMIQQFGSKAERLAKSMWMRAKSSSKVKSVVSTAPKVKK